MKLTIFLTLFVAVTAFAENNNAANMDEESLENAKICAMFEKKIKEHELNMRDDAYAKITLDSYKSRAKIFCSEE